jgi:hypothetical protein
VSALPLVFKAAFAALLLGSMLRAFLGAPARVPHRDAARALLSVTAVCYLGGATLILAAEALLAGTLLIMAGIETSCLAAWLVRAGSGGDEDDGDEGGGGGGGPRPPGPAPIDWAAFDRARGSWERPRATVR